MSYQNYNLLNDEEIATILPMTGKQAFEYMKKFKGEKLKQLSAIWLNERNIIHDKNLLKDNKGNAIRLPEGYSTRAKMYWEKYKG